MLEVLGIFRGEAVMGRIGFRGRSGGGVGEGREEEGEEVERELWRGVGLNQGGSSRSCRSEGEGRRGPSVTNSSDGGTPRGAAGLCCGRAASVLLEADRSGGIDEADVAVLTADRGEECARQAAAAAAAAAARGEEQSWASGGRQVASRTASWGGGDGTGGLCRWLRNARRGRGVWQ